MMAWSISLLPVCGYLLLVLVLLISASTSAPTIVAAVAAATTVVPSCHVVLNGIDVTAEYVSTIETDSDLRNQYSEVFRNNDEKAAAEAEANSTSSSALSASLSYVDCLGHSKCRNATITNCAIVHCDENEACNGAHILNVTSAVYCIGLHACHRTTITAAAAADDAVGPLGTAATAAKTYVACVGSGACDVAQIYQMQHVEIRGVKAGRKIHVEQAEVVTCTAGSIRNRACDSCATFLQIACLACGPYGCAEHINTCRYQLLSIDDAEKETPSSTRIQYQKCQPDTIAGGNHCPAGLQDALEVEFSTLGAVTTTMETTETVKDATVASSLVATTRSHVDAIGAVTVTHQVTEVVEGERSHGEEEHHPETTTPNNTENNDPGPGGRQRRMRGESSSRTGRSVGRSPWN